MRIPVCCKNCTAFMVSGYCKLDTEFFLPSPKRYRCDGFFPSQKAIAFYRHIEPDQCPELVRYGKSLAYAR